MWGQVFERVLMQNSTRGGLSEADVNEFVETPIGWFRGHRHIHGPG
jgi:hypothetical protein